MDRSSAGISGQYTRSNNGYNRPDDHAASSSRVQYRHGTVEQWDNPLRSTPGRNQFYHSSDACSAQNLMFRSVNSAQDFNALIKQEVMDGLVSKSGHFGHRYDGRHHSRYACLIKKYTSAAKRPLNRAEQSQLMRLLQNFTATPGWNWRSLTTTLHSFTSAGVFTLHNPIDERVKHTQVALMSTLLGAIIFKCNQKAQASYIGAQGVANLLWAMAKLIDSGQERKPGLNEAVAALLPHMNAQQDQFNAQEIANLLWAMAKLVNNGQEQTPELNEAVVALLPHVNAQKAHFKPQEIANLLWAMAKLVVNGQERTPELNEAVAALLPHVNAQKTHFKPQEITNLLWAMTKLLDNGQDQTPKLKEAVAALLPQVNAQKAHFKPKEIANLLWAMAKLVSSGLERAPGLEEAVAALLPRVNVQKDQFNFQNIANLLWAIAKLVGSGQERTPEYNEAIVALLPHVNTEIANFNTQEIANLLWAMAKLVDNGQTWTPEFKEAVAALLPHANAQKDQYFPQHIANLLWAMAKLADKMHEQTPGLKEAVAALLPHVNAQKANLRPQEIANLLWAMAKLVHHGQEQTPEFNEALTALLPLVKAQKNQCNAQDIANLLWAMASMGELIELNMLTSTFKSLVDRISGNPQFSQQAILMSLWAVMVCCARLSLVPNTSKGHVLEKHMDDLFIRLENTSPVSVEDQYTIAMAASWLGRPCPFVPHYRAIVSKRQSEFCNQLQSCIPSLRIEQEKSLNSLPPVDLLLPDHNMVIEIQGPSHYVGGDFKTRKGSALLKIALLQKAGFEVIEIPVIMLWKRDSMKRCIHQIKVRIGIPPQGHGSV
ncbi:DUF1601 domain-containing protein [Thalassotalea sp. G20_0]|uniref:DUF1601 domain-containing protein n=1 Tax=Thalassotalea sp. G20_0 TaxID=2821093 RepID=UPI001ADD2A42|nr:DUF1601 domain-containing protein [Thalassotalea sp. G20_0]MBO9497158.1 DUF1601 domain-containing protein [Thalassotalea sp. G20_0]